MSSEHDNCLRKKEEKQKTSQPNFNAQEELGGNF